MDNPYRNLKTQVYAENQLKLKNIMEKDSKNAMEKNMESFVAGRTVGKSVVFRRIKDIKNIDRQTADGRLLWAALIKLTTETHTDKTPNEVLELINVLADKIDSSKWDNVAPKLDEPTK